MRRYRIHVQRKTIGATAYIKDCAPGERKVDPLAWITVGPVFASPGEAKVYAESKGWKDEEIDIRSFRILGSTMKGNR